MYGYVLSIHVYTHTRIHMYIYTDTHAYTRIHMHIHMHVGINGFSIQIYDIDLGFRLPRVREGLDGREGDATGVYRCACQWSRWFIRFME